MERPLRSDTPSNHTWLNERLLLLGEFLRTHSIATIAPSSQRLCRRMIGRINIETAQSIAELGVGTGPITAALDKAMPAECRYLGVELNPRLHAYASNRLPHRRIVHGNAADLESLLQEYEMPPLDAVFSGLPMPLIPEEPRKKILEAAKKCSKPEAPWLQITCFGTYYKQLYRDLFDHVEFHHVFDLPYLIGGYFECRGIK